MIFLGDISIPHQVSSESRQPLFGGDSPVIANLEGDLVHPRESGLKRNKIFNDVTVPRYLRAMNVKVVSLANNHIGDYFRNPQRTIDLLAREGIQTCGAGEHIAAASRPAVLQIGGRRVFFLAFGWKPIKCRIAGLKTPGVNPLEKHHVLDQVQKVRRDHPEDLIVLLFHWNYELELYPQPMHRQTAFEMIDAGANAVVGSHSHCVGGIEVYKGAPIVYSLGNWHVSYGQFFGGRLVYPERSLRQLVFEWNPPAGRMSCRWFKFDPSDESVHFEGAEPLSESEEIRRLTPFRDFSHAGYLDWFRAHRVKKKLLPVYGNPDDRLGNGLKDRWVLSRQRLIDTALALHLKGGPV